MRSPILSLWSPFAVLMVTALVLFGIRWVRAWMRLRATNRGMDQLRVDTVKATMRARSDRSEEREARESRESRLSTPVESHGV